ncbi:MAG: helix-turn-helix domain-containing protein [Clostridia bacterium]|nr:helix-turn-helix domain-containing protein [Clostridia bacterium]
MFFNEKLKMLRKESGLTQEELAEKLNVSRQAITKWESGDGTPDIENLKQISILFNTTIDELVKEDKNVIIEKVNNNIYVQELEIDHTKHFDINICKIQELNILPNVEEKVKIELISNIEDNLVEAYKIKMDNLYNKLDIDIKSKKDVEDICINMYLPEKYIEEIELNSKIKTLNISNLELEKIEYDGTLKYINVNNTKGKVVLNTTKCDIEANYDKLDGILEVNIINSTARVVIPKGTEYKTILKGVKNQFIDSINTEESNNVIELNGINSKLIIIEK